MPRRQPTVNGHTRATVPMPGGKVPALLALQAAWQARQDDARTSDDQDAAATAAARLRAIAGLLAAAQGTYRPADPED